MKNILLIINPVSGRKKIQSKLEEITSILKENGNNVDTVFTEYRGHASEIASKAAENAYDSIICCGGDGTLNEIFNGLLRSKTNDVINVGYLPCGSTNDFAETLGLSTDPIQQTKNILNQNIRLMDVGEFEHMQYFSYIACFGALSDASYSAPQKLKNRVGHFAYILEGLKDFWHIKPIEARVEIDDKAYEGRYAFGSVSNTKSVAGLVKLSDEIVDLEDGLFEVLLVKYPKNPVELTKILYGATHSKFDSEYFLFTKAKSVHFVMKEEVPWSLDGERANPGNIVDVNNIEKAIKLYI